MDIRSTHQLLEYVEFRIFSGVFIETGSGHGDGIQRALDAGFEKVVSIEAQRENFEICAKRFANDKRVKMVYGRSEEELPRVIRQFDQDVYPMLVIYLDAHVSGEKSAGYQEWKAGNVDFFQDTIIRKELDSILTDQRRHIVIMDDINGLTDGFAVQYAEMITSRKGDYAFFFYDERIGKFYPDKLLVCVPQEAA